MNKLLITLLSLCMLTGCNMKFWQGDNAFGQTITGVGSVVVLLADYDETRQTMIDSGTKACNDGVFSPDECATFKSALLDVDNLVDTIKTITYGDDTIARIGAVGDLSVAFNKAETSYIKARAIVLEHFDKLDINVQRELQAFDLEARNFGRAMTIQLYSDQDDGFNINKALGYASNFARAISRFAVLL